MEGAQKRPITLGLHERTWQSLKEKSAMFKNSKTQCQVNKIILSPITSYDPGY